MLIVITGIALFVSIAAMAGSELEDQKRAETFQPFSRANARFVGKEIIFTAGWIMSDEVLKYLKGFCLAIRQNNLTSPKSSSSSDTNPLSH